MGKHKGKDRIAPAPSRLERGESLLLEHQGYFDKFMIYGYFMGVIIRFIGMIFVYLAYLSAEGADFYAKISKMSGEKQMVNASFLVVFSILVFMFAVHKLKTMRDADTAPATDLEMVRLDRH